MLFRRRPLWWLVAFGGLALFVLLVTMVLLRAHRSARTERLVVEVDAILLAHREARWARPVLRGDPIDGEAYRSQLDAIARFPTRRPQELSELLRVIAPGSETKGVRSPVAANTDAIEAYRAATRRAWVASGVNLVRGGYHPNPMQQVVANELLAASALERPAIECFTIAHDLLRLSQDYAIGAGVGTIAMHRHSIDLVLALEPRCLLASDETTLRAAERELALLARHPPPTGAMLDVELVQMLVESLADVAQAPLVPLSSLGFERWYRAPATLDGVDALLRLRAELFTVGNDYPGDLARIERVQRELESSNGGLVASLGANLGEFLQQDAYARAVVRLLWAAVRLKGEHAQAPEADPALLTDPELLDPLTGEPFQWAPKVNGNRLTTRAASRSGREAEIAVQLAWP